MTRWGDLLERKPEEPEREWVTYTVYVPAINSKIVARYGWHFSGYEEEVRPEMERLVRAYRAVGVEPEVELSKTDRRQVDVG